MGPATAFGMVGSVVSTNRGPLGEGWLTEADHQARWGATRWV